MTHDVIIIGAGQAGLAAAYHLQRAGLRFIILEGGSRPVGSWPLHYRSLRLFSPAKHAALPGLPFPADPEHYPTRDEVVAYLEAYARHFAFPVVTHADVAHVLPTGGAFTVTTRDGRAFTARNVITATGTYRKPYLPDLPGRTEFHGRTLHSLSYQEPAPFRDQRVIVVGAGNSAVQIAVELSDVANVTLASRAPVRLIPQRPLGRDVHDWITWLRVDQFPLGRFGRLPSPRSVFDTGVYRRAFRQGRVHARGMFERFTRHGVVWPGGSEEGADAVIFATGYRANLDFLHGTGALDAHGNPLQRLGVSLRVPGLYFVGLSGQRAVASATLRGAGPDADTVVRHLAARHARSAT